MKSAHEKLKNSKSLYSQAEEILLTELGLKDWQPTEETKSVRSFKDSFLTSGRLDAEYYQPKYEEIIEKIKDYQLKTIDDVVNIRKSIEPGSNAYEDNGIPFIRISDLSKYEITETEIFLNPEIYNDEELRPKKDTILLTKDGTLGIAFKVEKDLEIITSGAILHLTIKEKNILPDYLTLILNSIIVQLQAEQDTGGSIIQHWRVEEIKKVIIPILPLDIQQTISQKIQESFKLRKESKDLLELAKTMVEEAIEKEEI
ncbi:MAG: restriction endonuclease subunit S [Spirochaetes bacterium GWD1_27_9]|nr:MAG: restriction endonuclease subunit S [Spirochaetes bacterium GWB1_27_13]OHD25987.1 MAG: restriction endonuclease subunit S [Spirochaetes bacterium GWC1_27_15]OHD31666.1 MAG: restriction endonuclease subunit S [Spirochaetes bacterium GWD1_27_9]